MMNTVKEKWPEIIEHLRVEHELSNVSFNTWIQPLKVYDVVDNTVFILVNMNASVEYIEKKYQLPLKVCIAEITGTDQSHSECVRRLLLPDRTRPGYRHPPESADSTVP